MSVTRLVRPTAFGCLVTYLVPALRLSWSRGSSLPWDELTPEMRRNLDLEAIEQLSLLIARQRQGD
ncbi:MAG: hypothetical protein K6U89_04115 [Chloroflexi bacterium]|nr:hypothetical protein [Chloroflexota bacterium]GIW11422.1 MAG: hypothetical protein KatS3mg061_2479 [Dehalococcoidia bacterium]